MTTLGEPEGRPWSEHKKLRVVGPGKCRWNHGGSPETPAGP
ncbi:hypothetical protein QJS66_21615 [Kocuria rhizophila]|nr:hypothetical protein QJS66_21615 [Kocuria rhizophila]